MKDTLKKTLLSIAVAAGVVALSACNTMQGAGKDIEKAGEEIQEEAEKRD